MVCCIQINLFSQCLLIVYRINFAQLITDYGISGVERVSGVSERNGNARKRNGNARKRNGNARKRNGNARKRNGNASVNERKRKVNCGVNERRLKQRLCNAMLTDATR